MEAVKHQKMVHRQMTLLGPVIPQMVNLVELKKMVLHRKVILEMLLQILLPKMV